MNHSQENKSMNKFLLSAALAGLVAASGMITQSAQAAEAKEKCYGIAKAGKNDCASASGAHSCAGHATKNNDPGDWNYVEKGKCADMHGSLMAPKK